MQVNNNFPQKNPNWYEHLHLYLNLEGFTSFPNPTNLLYYYHFPYSRWHYCRFHSEAVTWHRTFSYWHGDLWRRPLELWKRLQRKKRALHSSRGRNIPACRVLDKLWKRGTLCGAEKWPRCAVEVVYKEWPHVLLVNRCCRTVERGRCRSSQRTVFSNEPSRRTVLRFQWFFDKITIVSLFWRIYENLTMTLYFGIFNSFLCICMQIKLIL